MKVLKMIVFFTWTMVSFFFQRWDGNIIFSGHQPSMVFQWYCHLPTIAIECFFHSWTIDNDGFTMVFQILGTMVTDVEIMEKG